jgi:FkbM family methyltransferase
MIQTFYRIIYNRRINYVLRNINRILLPLLPWKIKIPPSGVMKLKCTTGRVLKIKTNQTNYLTYLIFWQGGFHRFEYTDIFIRLIGFEPATGPLFFFRENVRINAFTNIKVESIALSHKDGEIEFYEIKNNKYKYLEHNLGGESNTGSKTTGRNFVRNKARTSTLDNYVRFAGGGNVDLIKMDTEGTENLILESSDFVLKEMKPIIICETLFNTIEPELERIMSSYGYEFYNHIPDGLQKTGSIRRKEDDGISNCFFVHPDKYHLIEEFVIK